MKKTEKMILTEILKQIESESMLISIETKPTLTIHLFKDSATAIIKDHTENTYKLVLVGELIENLKKVKRYKQSKKINFFEEGTRYEDNKIKIVEKPEETFEIKVLTDYTNKKTITKKFTVPKRVWIIKKEKDKAIPYIFAIKEWKEESTMLYNMPFPNVFSKGNVCWGLNKNDFKKDIKAEELDKLFFKETAFSPDNDKVVYKTKKKEYFATQFLEKYSKVPKYENLIEYKKLKDFLKEVT